MARRRKSPVKGIAILLAAVGVGTYFSDNIKEKVFTTFPSLAK